MTALPAGPVSVYAIPDTTQISIGEQFRIILKAETPAGIVLNFPIVPDTLRGIEIVSRTEIDTSISKDKSNITLTQSLIVTSFDSGYYVVEPFHFTSLNPETGVNDTFSTEAFLVTVQTVPIDTSQDIRDIKAPLKVPITWQEIVLILGSILAILILLWLIVKYFKKRKTKVLPVSAPVPIRPAHELALEALKKVEEEKLWQQGHYKKYHSAVSDIVREYIERRFDINALELTSDETLERIRRSRLNLAENEKLSTLLHTADLVKFAKVIPMADENERALRFAYDYVNATRPVIESDIRKESDL